MCTTTVSMAHGQGELLHQGGERTNHFAGWVSHLGFISRLRACDSPFLLNKKIRISRPRFGGL